MSSIEKNVCQYWQELEPVVCSKWDAETNTCTLGFGCNNLGTKSTCKKYDGEGTAPLCVLPDLERHVGNRRTGSKWTISEINGYNNGQCDGAGTDTTCSGYSPYHLGFSSLQPDDKDGSLGIDAGGFSAVISGTRLPLGYVVYNERSNLSRCYWWLDDPTFFDVDADTGYIKNITSKCINTDETVNQFKDFEWDKNTGMYRAPCNGCKPECPFYTGVCWQYCIDEKMQHGDKVLAEQMLELRYHIRRNRWTAEDFENAFIEPILYGWQGPPEGIEVEYVSGGTLDNWSINAIRAEITDFDVFTINCSTVRLTRGTQDQEGLPEKASLVRELQGAILKPIIRNVFEQDAHDNNIFEVASLEHEKILIFGDTFWYNIITYGINLSDPDLDFLPSELKSYDSMEDIKAAKSEGSYEEFSTELDTIITNLLQYYPEKITETEFGKAMSMFYLDMPTVWGENIILVLNKGSGTWEFDKISLEKLFCGGVIGQQSFSLRGDEGKTIDYLPAYERSFNCDANKNGFISFNFCSFMSARGNTSNVSYVYNDFVHKQIPANPYNPPAFETYYMGYQLYKVTAYTDLELEDDNVKFFGNAGYALVVIPDEDRILSNVIRNWEVDGDIILEVTGDDYEGIAGNDGGTRTIDMEIYEQGTDRLETNQIIVRPKDIKDFKSPCNLTLKMGGAIYTYQKRSFDELPTGDYEVVRESFLGVDDVANYRDNVDLLDIGNEQYELTKFGNDTLFISVIFTGAISGRIKGVTRTKMITWVRQPYCRDVEIKYVWSASYKQATLQPERVCYGPTSFEWGNKVYGKIYMPNCGDHNLGSYSLTGPMWYPYEACADTANYPTDSLTGRVTGVRNWLMELYEESDESAEPLYGNWNMRMLGPQDQWGYVCDNHASLWDCTCDWSYCNLYKEGENLFTGYGNYRCGLSLDDQVECTKNGGQLPKFGNPYRDFLMSYRSIDSVYYYYVEGTNFTRLRKWMPLYEFYTNADVTKGSSSYPYDIYSKDVTSPFIHPMGLFLASGSIEGVEINEQIDVDAEGDPTRHHFEDVFRTHGTTQSMMYPYPTNMKYKGISMTPILTWYTYRDYPGGDASKSIQWVWQEIWKDIERQDFSSDVVLPTEESESIDDPILSRGYKYGEGEVSGKFLFCTVDYPDYKYDYKIGEHELVCEESDYDINITAPIRNDEGEYESPYFFIQLDAGPERMFDADGNWDPTVVDNIYYDLYTTCTTSPWSTDITLFAPGYTNESIAQAEADDRVIVDYDHVGDEIKTYYQRGLNVVLVPSKFSDFLPREKTLIDSGEYEVRFSNVPSCTGGEEFDEIELAEWYPMSYCMEMPYCCSEGSVGFEFKFSSKKAVERLLCDFKFGAEEIEEEEEEGESWRLYHIPAISVFKSTDGVSYTSVHTDSSSMVLATNTDEVSSKRITIDWDEDTADILEPYLYFKIKLRISPTGAEVNRYGLSDYYDDCESVVHFECNYIYDSVFIDATESISTYERKYNISYGTHGDFPPHGYDSTGSLLHNTRTKENSTVYQRDSIHGVVGMVGTSGKNKTMNKVRGRILLECHEDKEPLPGSTLSNWEKEQKDIYDTIAINSGNTSIDFISTVPPGMEEKLNEANVSFPYSWTCTFDNTVILPLTEVKWYDPYGPCGQEFYWDLSNLHWQHRCAGSQFGAFSVGSKEVWKYKFHSTCTVSGALDVGTYGAITVYIHSIADLLNSFLNYVGFQSPTYSSTRPENKTQYTMPPPVSAY
jgi:hypothetical protein